MTENKRKTKLSYHKKQMLVKFQWFTHCFEISDNFAKIRGTLWRMKKAAKMVYPIPMTELHANNAPIVASTPLDLRFKAYNKLDTSPVEVAKISATTNMT